MLLHRDYEVVDLSSANQIYEPRHVFEIEVDDKDVDEFIRLVMSRFGKR